MTFAEVLEIKNGRNQRAVEDPNGEYPIYGSGGIMGYANDFICEAETVIIGRKGNINKPIFVDEPFWNVDTAFGLAAKKELLLPKYLYYFCLRYDFEKHNKTVTIPSLTKADLLNIRIELPDIEVQQRTIDILQKIERVLDLRQHQLTALDDLIKARFVEMFGDPVSNPKGWECVRFDSLCENLDSRRIPITSTDRKPGIYPYYGASGIVDYVESYIFDEDILLISEDGANLIMRTTPIAFSVSGKVWVNNHAHVVRFKEKATQKYIEVAFSIMDISEFITGSAQPKLNQAKLNEMVFCKPPLELQNQFADFVAQIDISKSVIQKSLDETQLLFDSLMQKYFG